MRRTLPAIALGLAASAIATGTASAGTYAVTACAVPAPLINNSWQPFNNNPTYLETSTNCGSQDVTGGSPSTSGLAAADVLQLSTNVPAGATAGWRFTAPAGDEISAVSMDRDLYDQTDGWVPQIVEANGNPLPGETCPFNGNNGGCEVSGEAMHAGLDTTSLTIELLCEPAPAQLTACGNGFSQHFARVELDSATVAVTDEEPPQIVSTSGSLFAGGLVRGTVSGTIDGSDNSGVQYARVYVDGALVAQQALACDFTRPAPCPASSSNQFSLDTSPLANGPHRDPGGRGRRRGQPDARQPRADHRRKRGPDRADCPEHPDNAAEPYHPQQARTASPRLRILSVTRTGRALHMRGSAARTLSGHVTIVVRYTLGARSHSVQKTVRVAHGKWTAAIGLPGGARTNHVTVIDRGSAGWLAQTVARFVYHRASRSTRRTRCRTSAQRELAGGPKRGFPRPEAMRIVREIPRMGNLKDGHRKGHVAAVILLGAPVPAGGALAGRGEQLPRFPLPDPLRRECWPCGADR